MLHSIHSLAGYQIFSLIRSHIKSTKPFREYPTGSFDNVFGRWTLCLPVTVHQLACLENIYILLTSGNQEAPYLFNPFPPGSKKWGDSWNHWECLCKVVRKVVRNSHLTVHEYLSALCPFTTICTLLFCFVSLPVGQRWN